MGIALPFTPRVNGGARPGELDPAGTPGAGVRVLASVNGEKITFDEFRRALSAVHGGEPGGEIQRPQHDPTKLLDRLITAKIVAQEAREMGFDAREDFRDELAVFRRNTLVEMTLRRRAEGVAAPDAEVVDKRFRIAVGEAKLDALYFAEPGDAETFLSRLARGESFEETVQTVLEDGSARGGLGMDYTKLGQLAPDLARAILALRPGEVSSPIAVDRGLAVLRLTDLTIPDDVEARRRAERESLEFERLKAIRRYVDDLRDRYATVNDELYEAIDFDVDGDRLSALQTDERPVVEIDGGEPITVAQVTAALRFKFFHGIERAAEEKKVNERKNEVLHELIVKRVVPIEGERLGLDRTEEFRAALRAHEEERLFNAAMRAVILPDVQIDESDVNEYYAEHKNEYLEPQRVRLESLAFVEQSGAERALDRLRRGADWQWTLRHAPGQVAGDAREGLIDFRVMRTVESLPQTVQEDLQDASAGDFLLYAPPDGPVYVLAVVAKPTRQPFELGKVRGAITTELHEDRARQLLAEWVAALRSSSDVEVLVSPQELLALVNAERGAPDRPGSE